MSKAKGAFKVYFDNNGNLLDRFYSWYGNAGSYKEEDNHVFQDRLKYHGYSGSHILFKSTVSGREYRMFLSDFHKLMVAEKMKENIIEGEFTFTKKGVVQGFKMILPKKQ